MSTTRVKDAGFLQQNIEKLILAVGVLILLAVIALFFLGNPFALTVGGQTYGSASEAVRPLQSADGSLEQGLAAERPFGNIDLSPPEFSADYRAMLNEPVKAPGTLPVLARTGLTDSAANPIKRPPPRFAMVYPPVPKNIEYKFGYDVLDTVNPELADAYYELWGGPRAPADFAMPVVAGEFDVWEWANRLKADPDSGAGNKLPAGIWSKRFGIAGVALLREEKDPLTGEWGNRKIVEALPGQSRVLPDDKMPVGPAESLAQIELLRESQAVITRPELPWVKGFVQIVPPGGVEIGANGGLDFLGDEVALGPTELRIEEIERKIEQLEERKRIQEERQRDRDDNTRPDRPRPDRPDRPRRGDDLDRGPRQSAIDRQIEDLRERIEDLRPRADKEREDRQEKAEKRRLEEEARRAAEQALRQRQGGSAFDPQFEFDGGFRGVELQEGASVRVWAADPTMEFGKTYRYKLLVAAINPLYAVQRLEPEQLADNLSRAAIFPSDEEIAKMDWIGPISVEPRARFFFTSGGSTRAKVDIYSRHDGILRKKSFDVSPGDPIGGKVIVKEDRDDPGIEVDMSVGAVLVDIEARRDLNGTTRYTMIYMDEFGKLTERTQAASRSQADRRELDEEIKNGPENVLRPDDQRQYEDDDFGFDSFRDDF